jgi:hypothetical protein
MRNGPELLGSSASGCGQLAILSGMALVVLLLADHIWNHTFTNLLGLEAPYFD